GQMATYTELNPDGSGLTLVVRETLAGPNIQPTAHPAGGTIAIRREPYYFCITGHRRPLGSRQTIVDRTAEVERLTDVLRSGKPAVIGSGLGGTTALGGGEKEGRRDREKEGRVGATGVGATGVG